MTARAARVGAVALALWTGACVTGGPSPEPADPGELMRAASEALDRDDFPAATRRLSTVVASCEDLDRARDAVLLLAAAELDTGNPNGSPSEAARLATYYLRLPDASTEARMVARALYRVAVHLETLTPPAEDAADRAEGDRPEPCPSATFAHDASTLAVTAPVEAPWLLALDADLRWLRRRTAALQQEIDRITGLLTSGTGPSTEEPGR